MGQQQLLLLVLATVIVGLATVAGIEAFDENQDQASADALTQEALTIASDAQAEFLTPEQFGGWGKTWDAENRDLTDLGRSSATVTNTTGKFSLTDAVDVCDPGNSPTLVVLAEGDENGDGTYGGSGDNVVCVGITGAGSDAIATNVTSGS